MRIHSHIYLIIVVALAALSGFLYSKTEYKYGLDVRGGIRLTYQVDPAKITAEQRSDLTKLRLKAVETMDRRARGALAVAEPNVIPKGIDQIVVELPGATDIETARRVFGTTAAIKWYHARTVSNPKGRKVYSVSDTPVRHGKTLSFEFARESDPTRMIKPGTNEYKQIINSWGQPLATGEHLARATVIPNRGAYAPNMEFSGEGSANIEKWSRTFRYQEEQLAAVLDDEVISIAPLKQGAILSGGAFIDMREPMETVKELTDLLNSGALPVDLKELQSEQVDPTIGSQALNQILAAGGVAVIIIALFVVAYYMFPGVIALTALGLYVLFTLTVLKALNATFSLAAIAGVILSVGMAVDANILIFERIKEELKLGKTLKSAIQIGFSRALPAIIDSNACTIITSLVLMSIGSGPVKGFASTLIIGVAISLFTAVTVTRWILGFLVGAGIGTNPAWYGLSRSWFGEHLETSVTENSDKALKVVQKRNVYFGISLATIVIPGLFFFMGGLKLNAEFLGGFEGTYAVQNQSTAELGKKLEEAGYKGGNIKIAQTNTGRFAYITVPPLKQFEEMKKENGDVDVDKVRVAVRDALGFTAENDRGFASVGPVVQKEAVENAVKGVLFSTLGIVIYLAIRFGFSLGGFVVGLRFSMAAIGALAHDILVVGALAAMFGYLMGWEVSALFLTAMLTVVGFSTHDTIVIFDRIRENLHKPLGSEDLQGLINRSITQSIARSINTSSTVIVTLLLLIFMGSATPDLKFFNTVMVCGIISGTYSSIFNASPILFLIDKAAGRRGGEGRTLMGIARRELAHIHVSKASVPDAAPGEAPQPEVQGYGQVRRRRASSEKKGHVDLD